MKIVYLTRGDGTDPRALKMCNSLAKLGHEVVFVGWDRTPEARKDLHFARDVKLRILMHAGVFGENALKGWGHYCAHVVRCLYEERPDAIQAVDEEKACLALPFKHAFYRHMVLDVYDSVISATYRSWWLALLARICRPLANLFSDCIIETAPELQAMLGGFARKSVVIENVPFDPGPGLLGAAPVSGPIRVALGGMLKKRRMGLDTLLGALDLMPRGSVVIEASGWLGDDYAKTVFATHPGVTYRWLSSGREFLNLAASCDALLYLRGDADACPYVAGVRPNRVFDALAVGRPLIVNPELTIARWLQEEDLGIVLARFDAPSLATAISSLQQRRAALPQQAAHMRRVFLDGHVWPVMEERLGELYRALEAGQKARAYAPA